MLGNYDVLTLVQVDIHGPPFVHFLEQVIQLREESIRNGFAIDQGVAGDEFPGDGIPQDQAVDADRACQIRNTPQTGQSPEQQSLILAVRRPNQASGSPSSDDWRCSFTTLSSPAGPSYKAVAAQESCLKSLAEAMRHFGDLQRLGWRRKP